jgi:hypothetical protein
MYCLGVKNAMWGIRARGEIDSLVEKLSCGHNTSKLTPESARRLIEGAVEYARNLGFAPHADYERAKLIFGDIDAAACSQTFEYGKDGKPYFIAGPNDDPLRCRQIVNSLSSRLGPQGHHFFMPALESDLPPDLVEMVHRDAEMG